MESYKTLENIVSAEHVLCYEKTIVFVCDERPDFQMDEAERIMDYLRDEGYFVRSVTVEEFCSLHQTNIGFMVVIPHASSLPAICSKPLRLYWEQGGAVLTLGGVLFGKYVEKQGNEWKEIPLPDHIFDAVHTGDETPGKAERIVIEGIVPTYKTYRVNDAKSFKSDSFYTEARLEAEKETKVVCPVARPYGGGYNMEYRNRFIPLVGIEGNSDRGDGSEGTAAFIMLSDTKGHLPFTTLYYNGTVSHTACGSAAANIGIMEQNLMDFKGFPELLSSIVSRMSRGLYIFSGGADRFVYTKGEKAVFGAKILNSSQDFNEAEVKIIVSRGNETVYEFQKKLMICDFSYGECCFECDGFEAGDYRVETLLCHRGELIDRVSQEIFQKPDTASANPYDFVRVEGDKFILKGKEWYPVGMNYWPLYMPSLERTDYWLSWLDKSNYIPEEVEKDLALMDKMGINTLFIRLDGDTLGRQWSQFEDFLIRCRRHSIKISLSYANATTPVHYNGKAFRAFMDAHNLKNDPIIFSHDISWEVDCQFLATNTKRRWDKAWGEWLEESYGTVENAEADFGVKVDRLRDGRVTCPPEDQFAEDGIWRIKLAAYRRFLECYFSKLWQVAVGDIKRHCPNQLVSHRRGPFGDHAKRMTYGVKYCDYHSLEAYHIGLSEEDYHASCIDVAYIRLAAGDKPVIWSEYGWTLTGMNRTHDFMWDHETERPVAYRMKLTEDYNRQMQKMFSRMGVKGTAPWWWPGGLRMVEMSDCGYCGPDGILRPFGKDYSKFIEEYFVNGEKKKAPERVVSVDFSSDARDREGFVRGSLLAEDIKAESEGKILRLTTEGFGTTSADTPLLAVGNVHYNGSNPLKYLEGEFQGVTLYTANGEVDVSRGETVYLPKGKVDIKIEAGNMREAKWLSPIGKDSKFGCIFACSTPNSQVEISIPFQKDAEWLEDTFTERVPLLDFDGGERKIEIYFNAEGRAHFGEIFKFKIQEIGE